MDSIFEQAPRSAREARALVEHYLAKRNDALLQTAIEALRSCADKRVFAAMEASYGPSVLRQALHVLRERGLITMEETISFCLRANGAARPRRAAIDLLS